MVNGMPGTGECEPDALTLTLTLSRWERADTKCGNGCCRFVFTYAASASTNIP